MPIRFAQTPLHLDATEGLIDSAGMKAVEPGRKLPVV
jgi:hypothetical protein